MVLSNPSWARAFEAFPRMLGMPATGESDPSLILAVIVPIIFGFMFGDVGQGLVITLTGLLLGRRFPNLKMLVPGGIVAIAFGFLFGSVFSREDIILALWLRPLANPIATLVAALAFGATVLIVGMLLQAAQAHWRGERRRWWGHRVGLLVSYVGLLFTPLEPVGLVFVAIGAAWFLLGSVALAEKRDIGRIAGAAGEFIEETMRLSVNTLSFARVGAFALGHAGLSSTPSTRTWPPDLVSCHTAEVGGYVVEGHVPAGAIQRLLAQKPQATGLAVPGMPIGAPGMEGGAPETYEVVLFGPQGRRTFARYKGSREV